MLALVQSEHEKDSTWWICFQLLNHSHRLRCINWASWSARSAETCSYSDIRSFQQIDEDDTATVHNGKWRFHRFCTPLSVLLCTTSDVFIRKRKPIYGTLLHGGMHDCRYQERLYGIYHPRFNGQVERYNRTILCTIRQCLGDHPRYLYLLRK